jgi:hypothetical protein
VTLVPIAQAVWLGASRPGQAVSAGWHESAGLGVLTFFDLLRFDVARGVRHGRWTFSVDFAHDLWRIL